MCGRLPTNHSNTLIWRAIMASPLSDRQRNDWYVEISLVGTGQPHKPLLDYLFSARAGLTRTYEQLREEVPELVGFYRRMVVVQALRGASRPTFTPDATSPTSGLLVRKWTGVIRMQRKVELGSQISHLTRSFTLMADYGARVASLASPGGIDNCFN